ncbi:hypothetical protein J6590_005690 [Homalodisca vitripennis]|nr:hypothetical protein J6590_005690 [Homalodisca vitripennis]
MFLHVYKEITIQENYSSSNSAPSLKWWLGFLAIIVEGDGGGKEVVEHELLPTTLPQPLCPLPTLSIKLPPLHFYTVSVGVVDKLALYCSSVRDPIDNNPQAAAFLLSAILLLTTLAQTRCGLARGDPTQLVATLRVTELVGGVSMLYGMLLHQGAPARDMASPLPPLPHHTITVTKATLQLLRAVAHLDLQMFQSVLGAEGMSLQLRHIASYLLWYCCQADERDLLHQVIEVVGYFAVMHHDNQMMLQSGHMPTVLQQLCNLPFEYFSDPSLSCQLFPTLLACCHGNAENRVILEQELSYEIINLSRTLTGVWCISTILSHLQHSAQFSRNSITCPLLMCRRHTDLSPPPLLAYCPQSAAFIVSSLLMCIFLQ